MLIYEYRIRAKGKSKAGKKWVIERRSMGSQRWISRTLMPLSQTWERLCPDTDKVIVSNNNKEASQKQPERYVLSSLNEPEELDILKSLEEIKKHGKQKNKK